MKPSLTSISYPTAKYLHTKLWEEAYDGRVECVDKILEGYKAVSDWPACDFYQARDFDFWLSAARFVDGVRKTRRLVAPIDNTSLLQICACACIRCLICCLSLAGETIRAWGSHRVAAYHGLQPRREGGDHLEGSGLLVEKRDRVDL